MVQNQEQIRRRNPKFLSQRTPAWNIRYSYTLIPLDFSYYYCMVSGMPALTIVMVNVWLARG